MRNLDQLKDSLGYWSSIEDVPAGALVPTLQDLVLHVEALQTKLSDLEAKLQKAEATAHHANNIASCLANGIQPD